MDSRWISECRGESTLPVNIVEEIADREDVDPVELSPPLHETVDPDALRSLATDATSDGIREDIHIEFIHHGYRVSVTDGEVTIGAAQVGG
jgi:hypothetical protein